MSCVLFCIIVFKKYNTFKYNYFKLLCKSILSAPLSNPYSSINKHLPEEKKINRL